MEIIHLPVPEINEYSGNPRVNDHAVPRMASLIGTHGFRVPILVRHDGEKWMLVDGHLRIKAARFLELETVPAIDVTDMDENNVNAFRISVNRASEFADWSVDLLTAEVEALNLSNDDLHLLTGMDQDTLSGLLNDAIGDIPVVEAPETTRTDAPRSQSADRAKVNGPGDTVSLSLSMPLEARDRVLAKLDALKSEHKLENRTAALMHVLCPAVKQRKPRTRTRNS